MSSPEMKRRRKKKDPTQNPSLPHDLLLSCLARASKLYYPTLSLVSKSFRSLIASPELYKARSLLGHTDICLYVCIYFHSDRNPRWFTLCRKPHENLSNKSSEKKKKLSGYVLAKVPIPHSPHSPRAEFSGLVAVGSSIYNIGGSSSSNRVSVLDCTTHTWSEAPSFRVKLESFTATVADRKIYVAGLYRDGGPGSFKNSIEVLDTETQIWDYHQSTCIDGKFHLKAGLEVLAYNSNEGRWDLVGPEFSHLMHSNSYCKIENVLYSCSAGALGWYDAKVSEWRKLKGLVGLPEIPDIGRVRLADYGGKMAVLWDERLPYNGKLHEKEIWCAEIGLKRRKNGQMWGKVEWFDSVLTVTETYDVVKVLAVTV